MNTYTGKHNTAKDEWYVVLLNGTPFDPTPSLKLRNHSPDGFSWSYTGSGPAQLALAILLNETNDEEIALQHYMDFKFEVIANLPREAFVLTSAQVKEWLASRT